MRQVPARKFPTKFPGWDLSHSSKFGIFVGKLIPKVLKKFLCYSDLCACPALREGEKTLVTRKKSRKIFWDHFSKSLVTIQVFTSETLASNQAQKWRKLVLTSFRSLRELQTSFSFISVAERQRLKLGMLEEKDTNCSRRLWSKITCGDVKSVPKIFGRSQQR